jgi:hypothetical protein
VLTAKVWLPFLSTRLIPGTHTFISCTCLLVLCNAVGVDRQGLAAFLVNEAYSRHPLDITFHWHAQPEAFDLKGRSVRCKTSNTRTTYGGARRWGSCWQHVMPCL